jgi:glycosidase
LWGYTAIWRCAVPPQPDGTTVRYRIGAWAEGGSETFADWPEVKATSEKAAEAFFFGRPITNEIDVGDPLVGTEFSYHVDLTTPPAWAKEAIIYHVFVDRFHPGQGRGWYQTDDVTAFSGGTLWGVIDNLDYLSDLGINCIWLSPVFPSPTSHGYDIMDLTRVDPKRGGDKALRTLIEAAHARGIRILMDLVCNHLSNEHPLFVDALANSASPYRDWFFFDESNIGYRTFFGVRTMPQINLSCEGARGWMIDNARFWLEEFDIDGYRLDHALGPGPDFWSDFWKACKEAKPDSFSYGEVVDTPEVLRHYIGRLDGCLDFLTSDMLRSVYGRGSCSEADFLRFEKRHAEFFPEDFIMPTFIDNHDMDRFLFIAGGNKDALKRAVEVQMRLPGPPILYYGTEVGVSQDESTRGGLGLQASRKVMRWGKDQDTELLEFYKEQIRARKERIADSSLRSIADSV